MNEIFFSLVTHPAQIKFLYSKDREHLDLVVDKLVGYMKSRSNERRKQILYIDLGPEMIPKDKLPNLSLIKLV